ncbi:MAG: hypothetical protein QW517_10420, partial [Thermofilaceae archaeon]
SHEVGRRASGHQRRGCGQPDTCRQGWEVMYLFDATSIVNLVKKGALKPLAADATINLAVYDAP